MTILVGLLAITVCVAVPALLIWLACELGDAGVLPGIVGIGSVAFSVAFLGECVGRVVRPWLVEVLR
jgi:hypothetical protein